MKNKNTQLKIISKSLQKEAKKYLVKKEKLQEKIDILESNFDKFLIEQSNKIDSLYKVDLDIYGNFSDDDLVNFPEGKMHGGKKTLYSTLKFWIKECLDEKEWNKSCKQKKN